MQSTLLIGIVQIKSQCGRQIGTSRSGESKVLAQGARRDRCFGQGIVSNRTSVRAAEVDIQFMICHSIGGNSRDDKRHLFLVIAIGSERTGNRRTAIHVGCQSSVLIGISDDGCEGDSSGVACHFSPSD